MSKVLVESIDLSESIIDIFEIKECFPNPAFFAVKPTYYNCTIVFSPRVIQKMLQWLIAERYIILDGTLTIKVRTKGITYDDASKEKNNET